MTNKIILCLFLPSCHLPHVVGVAAATTTCELLRTKPAPDVISIKPYGIPFYQGKMSHMTQLTSDSAGIQTQEGLSPKPTLINIIEIFCSKFIQSFYFEDQ